MIENSEKANLMFEINQLVNDFESVKNEVDIYCNLMKQIFLSKSNFN